VELRRVKQLVEEASARRKAAALRKSLKTKTDDAASSRLNQIYILITIEKN
jgi:hypothetical protein